MSNNAAMPSIDDLSAALAILEVPEPTVRSFREKPHAEMAWDFTDAVCASPQALVTDWRFHPSDPLREIFLRLYPAGIKAMIETENGKTFFPTKLFMQIDGVGARYSVKIPKEPDLHEIVFAFRAILPETVRIYTLAAFDGTDTYGHLVAVKETWQRLEELLGPWFANVFREQPGKQMFKRVGKEVKPKRDFLRKGVKGSREWLDRMKSDFDSRYQEDLDFIDMRLDSPYLLEHPGRNTMAPQHQEKARQEWRAFVATPDRLILVNYTTWGGRTGAEGLVDLWDKRPGGWTKIRRALEYFFLGCSLSASLQEAAGPFLWLRRLRQQTRARHRAARMGDRGLLLQADAACREVQAGGLAAVAFLAQALQHAQPGDFRRCLGAGKILWGVWHGVRRLG